MSLKADIRAEVEALKSELADVDQCVHNDLFELEARLAKLEAEAKAKVEAANAAVRSAAVDAAQKL